MGKKFKPLAKPIEPAKPAVNEPKMLPLPERINWERRPDGDGVMSDAPCMNQLISLSSAELRELQTYFETQLTEFDSRLTKVRNALKRK
jgi:hypothetical protein